MLLDPIVPYGRSRLTIEEWIASGLLAPRNDKRWSGSFDFALDSIASLQNDRAPLRMTR